MTVGGGPERAVSEEVQPGGAQPQQDRVLAGPPPRPRRPPGRPEARREAEALRSSHRDRRRWQMEVRNALLEGGNGR